MRVCVIAWVVGCLCVCLSMYRVHVCVCTLLGACVPGCIGGHKCKCSVTSFLIPPFPFHVEVPKLSGHLVFPGTKHPFLLFFPRAPPGTLMILKSACSYNASYIDRLISVFMRSLQKMVREHLSLQQANPGTAETSTGTVPGEREG